MPLPVGGDLGRGAVRTGTAVPQRLTAGRNAALCSAKVRARPVDAAPSPGPWPRPVDGDMMMPAMPLRDQDPHPLDYRVPPKSPSDEVPSGGDGLLAAI